MLYTALHDTEIEYLVECASKAPPGVIVCAGTWRGGDLMAMIKACPDRYFIVIDSFRGLASPKKQDINKDGHATEGMFDIQGKKNYIKNFTEQGIRIPDEIHEMWITESNIESITTSPIAMLWLDLDHYTPTDACLKHFSKNIVDDGIILVHDYALSITPGVKQACDKYFSKWEHKVYGIWRTQNG
jgi:hypothetical protein